MLGREDHEGHCARMTFWQVVRYGPRFPVDLNRAAWTKGSAKWRRLIACDWAAIGAFAVFSLSSGQRFLYLHVAAMAVGQCLSALLAVWITHRETLELGLAGRSQRGIIARLAYLMFYHREHHLFPGVPVSRLPELAERLDRQAADYAARRLPVVALFDRT